ncbi:hypothetical protein BJ322DRAFT_1076187 [Thelephora terrestris]|uniref:Uncharacterized protein n=1 Tax=Thelephora terrestris TaxID=56493 RepID=A0A9P6L437_9AGAM|nr:hypothetical protein BJ322DRAFT_1076187 [Thelephora terrestris]
MTSFTILLTLSLLTSAVKADEYCYYDSFGDWVCRNRLSTGARIAIAAATFVIVSAIFLAYSMRRRRQIARANMAFIPTAQNPQQGYPNQYPPQHGGFFGMLSGGQKPQQDYGPQQPNGQYSPPQNAQYDSQYNSQYQPQYNAPQYPPAAYDQQGPNQPAPPYPGYAPPPPQR